MKQQQVNKTNNIYNSQREKSVKKEHKKNSIYVINLVEQSLKDQQLQEIKKYGKVIDQEVKKDNKGKRGNMFNKGFSRKIHNWNK